MIAQWIDGLALVLATDNPAMPTGAAMQVWLHLGWSVVLAWLGAALVGRCWPDHARRTRWHTRWEGCAALGLTASVWLPGSYSPAYWLGLAFQMPSVLTVLLCGGLLWERWAARSSVARQPQPPPLSQPLSSTRSRASGVATAWDRRSMVLVGFGVLSGWALLLDSFAVLPFTMYAFGLSSAALALVLIAVLLPWIVGGPEGRVGAYRWWLAPVALVVFVVWRLPTGNVWDAVLDPWLWLVLNGQLAVALFSYRVDS